MKAIKQQRLIKLFSAILFGTFLAACGSNPTYDMNPSEIAQHLGYTGASQVESVPEPANFDLRDVNLRTAVLDARFGREYLVTFEHSCPGAATGGNLDTTATGGTLDTDDSIIIDDTEYCRIAEIYVVE